MMDTRKWRRLSLAKAVLVEKVSIGERELIEDCIPWVGAHFSVGRDGDENTRPKGLSLYDTLASLPVAKLWLNKHRIVYPGIVGVPHLSSLPAEPQGNKLEIYR